MTTLPKFHVVGTLAAGKHSGVDMKVSIKDLSVDMEIKNTGVELDVYSPDGTKHLGDLIVTRSGLIWCKGKTGRANGKSMTWAKFIEWAESQP